MNSGLLKASGCGAQGVQQTKSFRVPLDGTIEYGLQGLALDCAIVLDALQLCSVLRVRELRCVRSRCACFFSCSGGLLRSAGRGGGFVSSPLCRIDLFGERERVCALLCDLRCECIAFRRQCVEPPTQQRLRSGVRLRPDAGDQVSRRRRHSAAGGRLCCCTRLGADRFEMSLNCSDAAASDCVSQLASVRRMRIGVAERLAHVVDRDRAGLLLLLLSRSHKLPRHP